MNNTGGSFQKFLLLWSGELVSAVGSGLTSFGLGVYVFSQTGRASAMALVTLLAFMPSLLLSAFAGVLADRYDRRLLMVLGDGLSALGLVYILICMIQGEARLWQICAGVTFSSLFASLLEPAYRATVTDLLTEEQYAKASGLVSIAGSAKYLISPILAGFLLAVSDIRLLLVIDICTFFLTVTATLAVRKGLASKKTEHSLSMACELRDGWNAVSGNRGVLVLVFMTSAVTFFMGVLQTLLAPLFLAFTDSSALGVGETVSALGMLVSSFLLAFAVRTKGTLTIAGIFRFKKGYQGLLCASLGFAGICMAVLGLRENLMLICTAGFLFFAMLPFANASLDYLIRTHIDNSLQGRAWGLIGLISQMGYVLAYGVSGLLADYVFTPLLLTGGPLSGTVGKLMGTGTGRGTGLLILVSGLLLALTAVIIYRTRAVRELESEGAPCISD